MSCDKAHEQFISKTPGLAFEIDLFTSLIPLHHFEKPGALLLRMATAPLLRMAGFVKQQGQRRMIFLMHGIVAQHNRGNRTGWIKIADTALLRNELNGQTFQGIPAQKDLGSLKQGKGKCV